MKTGTNMANHTAKKLGRRGSKLIAARKRQLHHNPALSQWHIVVVFCQFRQKPGFFMQNVFQKGLQRPFWLSLHYVA